MKDDKLIKDDSYLGQSSSMSNPTTKSNCCNAEMKVITDTDLGRAGTSHYECEACGKPCDPKPITDNLEGWEKFTMKIPSKRDGKEVGFTLEQLFNDLELGNAVAEDLQLPYEKRLEAFNWLKSNVKQFISDLRKKDGEGLIEMFNKDISSDGFFNLNQVKFIIDKFYAKTK
jgi:methionyl-tRNA synthetase